MAGQEEAKQAASGQTPTPIKLHASGLAGATQHLTHPVDTADRTATVPIAKSAVGGKTVPKPQSSALPPESSVPGVRTGSDDKTMRLRKDPSVLFKQTSQAPAGAPSPSAQTIKLPPSGGAPASAPTIKLTPKAVAGAPSPSAQTIKLPPSGGAPASAPTIKLAPQSSGQTVSLVKQVPTGGAPASAPTIKLTPKASQTVPPAADAASQTVRLPGSGDGESSHTVKIPRLPPRQGMAPMPEPSSSAKPPSAIPGAKQTIKLRPSSVSSTVTAVPPPAGGPVTLNAGPAGKTIKLVPVGNGGAKVVPSASAQQQPAASGATTAAASSAPAQQPGATAASSAPAQQPAASSGQTMKLSLPGGQQPAAGGKPMGKTMKLSLHKPAGTPAAGNAGPSKVPDLKLPGKKEEIPADAALKQEEEERPSVVFLLISIAAMLAVVFTVLLMSVQFANMYHGADVNIPGMTRLSGTR